MENISFDKDFQEVASTYWSASRLFEDDLLAVIENSPDGIVVVLQDDSVGFVNQSFSLLTAIKRGSILYQNVAELDAKLSQVSSKVIEHGHAGVLYKLNQDNRNNPHKFYRRKTDIANQVLTELPEFRVLHKLVKNISNSMIKRIVYYKDITVEYTSNLKKTEFLLAASHELKSPITNILGFSEILKSKIIDDEELGFIVDVIFSQSVFLNKILKDLLDVNQIEFNSGSDFDLQHVDLNREVKKMIDHYCPPVRRNKVEFIKAEVDAQAIIDVSKFKQVLYNLINNAYKYSTDNVVVKIAQLQNTQEIAISVIDFGVGLTHEQQTHLFRKFWRAKPSQHEDGIGLGLVLVKEIVELLNGRVEICSKAGIGTTVSVMLPYSRSLKGL